MLSLNSGDLATTKFCGFSRVVSVIEIIPESEPSQHSRDLLCRVSMDGRTMLRRISELKPLGQPHRPEDIADCVVPLDGVFGGDDEKPPPNKAV